MPCSCCLLLCLVLPLQLFRTMPFHSPPRQGVLFHYFQIVVFMSRENTWWAEVLSHGLSNLNSIVSPVYLEREKIYLLNTLFPFPASQRDAPSDNSRSAAGHICLKHQLLPGMGVAMFPEGEGGRKPLMCPQRLASTSFSPFLQETVEGGRGGRRREKQENRMKRKSSPIQD